MACEATFESSGAVPFPFPSTVWQEMQRDSEKIFLPLATFPSGSASASFTARASASGTGRANRAFASASISASASWKSGIVAFGSTVFGPFSHFRMTAPPVLAASAFSGGASER